MNLANKTTLLLVAFALVPVILLAVFTYASERQRVEEDTFRHLEEVISRRVMAIENAPSDKTIPPRFAGDYAYLGKTGSTMVLQKSPATNGTSATNTLSLITRPRFPDELEEGALQTMLQEIALSPAIASSTSTSTPSRLRTTDFRGKEVLAVAASVPSLPLALVVKMDADEVFAPLTDFRDFFLLFSFTIALVGVFLGLLAAKRLTDPLRLLSIALADFASNPEREMTPPPGKKSANDEIGMLSREFHSMSETIRNYHLELEDEVKKRTEELESFSYSVSHDLRAPLRAMDGFVKVFMEEYGGTFDEEGKRILSIIQKNAAQMGQLIDDLLAFSRLGRQEVKKERIGMRALAESVWDEYHDSASEREINFPIGDLPDAFADGNMIRLVFVNLLSNALKFSRNNEKPEIEVRGRTEGKLTTYFVKDNGVGFDMKYADKLFNVFQRLHSEEEFEGTGVGLANVKRIVERHGGTVRAEGVVGEGATFYFTLPNENGDDRVKT